MGPRAHVPSQGDEIAVAFDLTVKGGLLVLPEGSRIGDLGITDGKIAEVGDLPVAGNVVDAGGLMVFPGMVDTHVHLMDPGPTEREDFPTGTRAAAARARGGPIARLSRFPREVIAELSKVIWPTRKELVTYTIVVIVFVSVLTALATGLDIGFSKVVTWVFA